MKEHNKNILEIKSIAYFLKNENKKEVRNIKYKDLLYKFNSLSMEKQNFNIKEKIDIAIFTANTKELDAFNRLLRFRDEDTKEYKNINGLRVWKSTIERKNKPNLTLIITMIGKAGNISCSLGCMRVLDFFDVKFSMLCGITAGLITKYSVVFSEGVVDYEHQRLEPGKITYRPEPIMINTDIAKNIPFFLEKQNYVKTELINLVKVHPEFDTKDFDINQLKSFSLEFGIIASGEKLLADNLTLNELSVMIPIEKGIIAGEMEGSGFSHACNEFKVPWIVIKGISDNGGNDKNEINKKYQFIAALGSALSAIYYLKTEYRSVEDYDVF